MQSEWRHSTVIMETLYSLETLYSQSRDNTQSVWRQYSQNGNTIQIRYTTQNGDTKER
jgi:hypothetical protein